MQMHGLPFKVPNTKRPACPCTGRGGETVSHPDENSELDSEGVVGLTGALGKVGDVLVVEQHLVLQHVSQASEPRPTHDAHHGADVCLCQQPVGGGLTVLIAVTGWAQISISRPYSHII